MESHDESNCALIFISETTIGEMKQHLQYVIFSTWTCRRMVTYKLLPIGQQVGYVIKNRSSVSDLHLTQTDFGQTEDLFENKRSLI